LFEFDGCGRVEVAAADGQIEPDLGLRCFCLGIAELDENLAKVFR
jgi:hypothetical protein